MDKSWGSGLTAWLVAVWLLGCSTTLLPPSEATMAVVRSYKTQRDSMVASGQLSPAQARDMYYARLGEIQPPLPELDGLVAFRKQIAAQVASGALTPEKAEERLTSRESEMLTRWEEMSAKYSREQREFDKLQQEQQRGFQQQQMPVGGRPF